MISSSIASLLRMTPTSLRPLKALAAGDRNRSAIAIFSSATYPDSSVCWCTWKRFWSWLLLWGGGAEVLYIWLHTRSDQPQAHYPNWKFAISMLPWQKVLSSRHPTPQPLLHVNLEYRFVGRRNWRKRQSCNWWKGQICNWPGHIADVSCVPLCRDASVVVQGVRNPTLPLTARTTTEYCN